MLSLFKLNVLDLRAIFRNRSAPIRLFPFSGLFGNYRELETSDGIVSLSPLLCFCPGDVQNPKVRQRASSNFLYPTKFTLGSHQMRLNVITAARSHMILQEF